MLNKFLIALVLSLCAVNVFGQVPQPVAPKKIDGGVVNGKATNLPQPAYPAEALAAKVGGEVKVQVTIDETGAVVAATAVSGHQLLRAVAERAAMRATFKPTLLSGQPVRVVGVITYNFVSPGEVKLPWANVAFFLKILAEDNWRPDTEKYLALYLKTWLAEFPEEKEKLFVLSKTQGNNRVEVVEEVLASLETKLSESGQWQIKFGKSLGEASIECRNQIFNAAYRLDENRLRENLREIGRLAGIAPPEATPQSVEALNRIAAYAEKPDLKESANLVGLMQSLTEFVKTVSSGTGK